MVFDPSIITKVTLSSQATLSASKLRHRLYARAALPDRQTSQHPIAKRLKQARIAAGLSQKELGIRAGIDPSVASQRVNQYERQRHQPAFEIVRSLANVLKLPSAYFYATDEQLAELIALYGRLSSSRRQSLLAIARKAVAD